MADPTDASEDPAAPGAAAPAGPTDWRDLGPKDILTFALRTLLWYVLFLLPWTGLDDVYGACFRFTGNAFMRSVGDVTLSFTEIDKGAMDTAIELREGKVTGTKTTNSRLMGYLPTMFLAALVLATKTSWRTRVRRLLMGAGLVSLFVALRVYIDLYATLAPNEQFRSVSVSDGFRNTLTFIRELAAIQPSTGFIAAGVVWVILTLLGKKEGP